jgi:hypothetical protein
LKTIISFNMSTRATAFALACAALFAAIPAHATDPFEIQVYQPDLNEPGQFGLELHTNATIKGAKTPEFDGQIAPNHVGRVTLEPALGVTSWLELGAYVQAFVAPDSGMHFGGFKLRAKMVPRRAPGSPWFYGLNVEIGRVPHTVDEQGWANELRPLAGYDDGHWLFDVNPIIGYALSGPDKFKPELEPCAKVGWNTQRGFMVGLEYYSGLGLLTAGLSPLKQQEHMLYAVFDLASPAGVDSNGWELNVGLGRALTDGSPSTWSAKAIVGHSF